MRIGLVGYGTGGRHFHAPYIATNSNEVILVMVEGKAAFHAAGQDWVRSAIA